MATVRRTPRLPGITSIPRRQPTIPSFIGSCLVKARAGMSDAAARTQMAEDMREAGQPEGGITIDGLKLLGWTQPQIDRIGESARVWAQALSGATV